VEGDERLKLKQEGRGGARKNNPLLRWRLYSWGKGKRGGENNVPISGDDAKGGQKKPEWVLNPVVKKNKRGGEGGDTGGTGQRKQKELGIGKFCLGGELCLV